MMVIRGWLLVLLLVLAVARATRLVNEDVIFDRPRLWLMNLRPQSLLPTLIECSWCASVWLGLGGAAVLRYWPHAWPVQIIIIGLAASEITGVLALVLRIMGSAADQLEETDDGQ